jgi:hypothetical protein
MSFEKFAVWLSGFADLNMGKEPTKEQWELIVERLAETFDQPDPSHKSAPAVGGHVPYDPSKFGVWGESGSETVVARPAVMRTSRDANGKEYIAGLGVGVTNLVNTVTAAGGTITSQGTSLSTLQSRVTKAE